MGGYERHPAPWALDGVPPDFNGKLLAPDWPRFEEIMDGRRPAGAGHRRRGREPDDQRPRGVHAGQRVHPRRERRPRVLRRGRLLRPRHRRGGRHRPPDGDLDRRGRARARPLEDGQPAVRSGLPVPGVHAGPDGRGLRHLLRHPLPERGTPRRPAAPHGPHVRDPHGRSARPSARSPAGSARTGSSRTRPRAMPGSGRAAGRGCTGRRRSAPRRSRPVGPPACSTRRRSPSSRSPGRVPSRSSQQVCANDIDRAIGSIVYTQLLDRRGGIQADLTVTRLAEDAFMLVTGTAVGNHDAAWLRRHLPDDGTVTLRDVTAVAGLLRAVGPAGPRHPRARSRATTCRTRASRS